MTRKSAERSAFFAGSFNPFTIGHKSIVERALTVFDRIVIGIGVNAQKPTASTAQAEERAQVIRRLFASRAEQVKVVVYTSLTAHEARQQGCCALLRGVRSVADFEAERNLADINRSIFNIETFILYTEPELAHVSSSLVRELNAYGINTDKYTK